MDFSRNVFAHLCFDTCSFEGDCNFSELTQEYSWEILQPTILGQTAFIGTEDNMLFNSKTKIELTPDCFFELGHVTFDYCNIKDLGTAFVDSVKDLEDSGLVQIHPSCCVERLTVIYEYPYTAIKANIIEDFVHLITRYFSRWHSVNLSVNITRDRKNNRIKIVFKTTDDLSDKEFNRIMHKFSTTLQTTETNDPEIVDIQKTYRNIIERINDSNALTPENKWEILSLQGNIHININTLSIMEKKEIKFDNNQIGIVSTGDYAEIQNNTFNQNSTETGNINYAGLSDELNALIRELSQGHQEMEHEVQLLKQAVNAANEKNESQLIELLKKIPAGIIKIAKGVGVGILGSFIAKYLGI